MSMFSTPFLSVMEEEGQPEQEPASCTDTMPVSGSKPLRLVRLAYGGRRLGVLGFCCVDKPDRQTDKGHIFMHAGRHHHFTPLVGLIMQKKRARDPIQPYTQNTHHPRLTHRRCPPRPLAPRAGCAPPSAP